MSLFYLSGHLIYLKGTSLVNVLLRGSFVLADKVVFAVPAKPNSKLAHLLSKAGHGLLVHVRLGKQFGQ